MRTIQVPLNLIENILPYYLHYNCLVFMEDSKIRYAKKIRNVKKTAKRANNINYMTKMGKQRTKLYISTGL